MTIEQIEQRAAECSTVEQQRDVYKDACTEILADVKRATGSFHKLGESLGLNRFAHLPKQAAIAAVIPAVMANLGKIGPAVDDLQPLIEKYGGAE